MIINYLQGHTGQVRCSVFNRNGEKLATASLDGTAKVSTKKERLEFQVFFSVCVCVHVSVSESVHVCMVRLCLTMCLRSVSV